MTRSGAHASKGRGLVAVVALVALAALPLAGAGFYVDLVTKVLILALFAASLDLLVGTTGLVSFGHAAFFGLGAYALALIAPRYEPASFWWTLLAAVAISALAALVVGAFVIRTRGVYFIMVTLAFAQMFFYLFHDTELGRGSDGISMNFKPSAAIGGFTPFDLGNAIHTYYLVLAVLAAALVFLDTLVRSPLGHALQGIRSNEHRMLSLGFPVARYKLAAFTIAGALAGLAGFLSAVQFGFVNPELLSWHQSGNVLLMVILGGFGRLYGGVIGAFVFVLLQELFQAWTRHWQLPFGLTIIALVLFVPGGLASLAHRLRGALVRERAR